MFPELGNNGLAQWSANSGSQAKTPSLGVLPRFLKKNEMFIEIFVDSHAVAKT